MAGRFQDRIDWQMATLRDVLRMHRTGGFPNRKARYDAERVPRVTAPGPLSPPTDASAVTWVGHATCLVQMAGLSFLTDPVWSMRLPGFIRRLTPPGVPFDRLPPIDAVFISHDHYDHLDARTVKRLPRSTQVFAPLGIDAWFRRRGFRNVTGLDWWEGGRIGDIEATLVPVQHWCQRGLLDKNRRLWGGWVLAPPRGPRVFFAGDTGYFGGFHEIGKRHPAEIAILPVGAYAPRWFMQPVHMDPEEAVRAADDMGAAYLVPMHWGTFALSREPLLEPLERTRRAWAAAGNETSRLWDLALGERRMLAHA